MKLFLFFQLTVLIAIALFLRVYEIADRPLHSDEGVNFYFVQGMLKNGYYHYSHQNYHGPAYFYLLMFCHYFFGDNELSHRLAAIIPGMGIVLMPFFLIGICSRYSLYVSALLLALSSSLVYYARYSIHESLLVLSSIWLLFAAFRWVERREGSMLVHIGLATALLFTTKETSIITYFAFVVSGALVYSPLKLLTLLRVHFPFLMWGVFLFFGVSFTLFSGFFQDSDGIRELFLGIQQWIGRGHSDTGHHKPFKYYFIMMKNAEPIALVVIFPLLIFVYKIILSFVRALKGKNHNRNILLRWHHAWYESFSSAEERFMLSSGIFALVSFFLYSYVPYKTPWLIINIVAPAIFSVGLFISIIRPKILSIFILVICLGVSTRYVIALNVAKEHMPEWLSSLVSPYGTYGDSNPYSYVHTSKGMIDLLKDIEDYASDESEVKILLGAKSYWPLPYYLRHRAKDLLYFATDSPDANLIKSYQILILDYTVRWSNPDWDVKYYRLSDVQESRVFFLKKESNDTQAESDFKD